MVVFPRDGAFHFSGKLEMLNPPPMGELNLNHTGDKFTAIRDSGKPDSGRSPRSDLPACVAEAFVHTLAGVTAMLAVPNYPRLAGSARKLHKSGYSAQRLF
jgi:hypothetical protein